MEVNVLTEILGKTCIKVVVSDDKSEMTMHFRDGALARFYHSQDCCENVSIDDIVGDFNDLIGNPLTMAEEVVNRDDNMGRSLDSFTWTFYKFATVKGYVDVKWLGESNGCYSESVDINITQPHAP